MTIKEIEYILGVAESASISEAAKKLFVSQPSITHAIQSAETEIGFKIFERGRTGVEITPEGHEFLDDIRLVYEQMSAVETKYVNKTNDKKIFSLSLQHFQFGIKALTEIINGFDYDKYTIKITEDDINSVISGVAEGVSRIGIITFNERYENVIMKEIKAIGLEFYGISELMPYIITKNIHSLNVYKELTSKEILGYPQVMFNCGKSGGIVSDDCINNGEQMRKIIVNDTLDLVKILQNTESYYVGNHFTDSFLYKNGLIKIPLKNFEGIKLGWIKKSDVILNKTEMDYLKLLNNIIENSK